ncbi:MAG: lipid droplet-associated protein, partial [Mycobacterium sp.]|nr:lipid droplet-associated protein [Mycobacterium sp.]
TLAELAIKGDSTLESIFPPKDEMPEWATFDEDLIDMEESSAGLPAAAPGDTDRLTEGRYALYSLADAAADASTQPAGPSATVREPPVPEPPVAAEIDYSALTLAQLRARLQSLGVEELEALLAYEQATAARAPFQTLLANRITRANAK